LFVTFCDSMSPAPGKKKGGKGGKKKERGTSPLLFTSFAYGGAKRGEKKREEREKRNKGKRSSQSSFQVALYLEIENQLLFRRDGRGERGRKGEKKKKKEMSPSRFAF